jgi:transposase-like protein
MGKQSRYSKEVQERAVRLVFDHEREHNSQWATIISVADKIGCTPETLRRWVRQKERDEGRREGMTTEERDRLKVLERENRELRRANDILRKASAYFAQAELDRPRK